MSNLGATSSTLIAGHGSWLSELERVTAVVGELHQAFQGLLVELASATATFPATPMRQIVADHATAPSKEAVMAYANEVPQLTSRLLDERFGLAGKAAAAVVRQLVQDGELKRHGQGRGTYYTLPHATSALGDSPESDQLRIDQVVKLATHHGDIRTRDVAESLGLSAQQVRPILAEMVDRGILKRHGQKRGTFFTLSDPAVLGVTASAKPVSKSIEELLEESATS
jgi:ATP-dependent DNA helicase RecG